MPDALSRAFTLVCEPSWLARVYRAQVDSTDEEMKTIRTAAASTDARFVLRQ